MSSDTTTSRPAELPPLQGPALVLGTVALSLATFMNVLDTSIANVSLPAIAGDLGVSPNQGTWVITSFGVANAIITESALSFLGLGFPSDFPTWGRLLFDGANFMTLTPARVIWPGLAISLTVLSINFIGDGLRDALDPRIRGR